jgi:hypothetical protein
MFGSSALTRIKPRHRTYPVLRSGSRDRFQTCPAPDIGHVRFSDTPTGRFLLGAIKGPPRPPAQLATQFTSIHFEPILLELKTSLSQASLQSKLSKRDLSLSLE